MASHEHQPQQIITNVIVNRAIQIGHGHLPGLELVAEFLVLAFQPLVAAKMIDRLGGPSRTNFNASSSIAVVPEALSSAPL